MYRDESRSAQGTTMQGVFLTTRAYPGSIWFPSWDKNTYKPTVFRPLGPVTADGKALTPWRFTADRCDYTDWIVARRLFRGGSARRTTFIVDRTDAEGRLLDDSMEAEPATVLFHAWKKGKEAHPEWLALGLGGSGRSPALPPIRTFAALQGALLEHNGNQYWENPFVPAMLWLTWSAKTSLEEKLEEEVKDYSGDVNDFNRRYVAGDFLNADTGKLLYFYNSRTKAGQTVAPAGEQPAPGWGQGGGKKASEGRTTELAYFMCDLKPSPPLPRTQDGRLLFADQGTAFFSWAKSLRCLSTEDRLKLLIGAFEDVPALLRYAFAPYSGWLPPSMLGTTISTPAAGQNVPPPTAAAAPAAAQTAQAPAEAPTEKAPNWGGASKWGAGAPSSTPAEDPEVSPPGALVGGDDINEFAKAPAAKPGENPPAPEVPVDPAVSGDAKVQAAHAKLMALRKGPKPAQG